jgi:acetyltransferase-like isoleucine patch superfamily enzyme
MDSLIFLESPSWSRRFEAVSIAIAGSIPLSVGILLRRLIYRQLFKYLGSKVTISPGVEFVCANQIEIGNGVHLDSGVRLNCSGKNSRIQISDQVYFDRDVELKGEKKNASIVIGDRTSIGSHCCISGSGSVYIGKNCLIAPYVGIFSSNHNFMDGSRPIRSQGTTLKPIVIEDDCWIGSGAKILAGVTLGQGSVIGAGAVVTKDIPPYSVAVGVPAQVVSHRERAPFAGGYKLKF